MYINWFTVAALALTTISMTVLAYLIVRQFRETRKPRDGFTKLRRSLVVTPVLLLICLAPSIPWLTASIKIPPRSTGASLSAVLVRVGVLGACISMLYSYTYKEEG